MKYTKEVSDFVENAISRLSNKYKYQRFFGADTKDLCQLVRISVWKSLTKIGDIEGWQRYAYAAVRTSMSGYCANLNGNGTMRHSLQKAVSINSLFYLRRMSEDEKDEDGNILEPRDICGGEDVYRYDFAEFLKEVKSKIPNEYRKVYFEEHLSTKTKLKKRFYFRRDMARRFLRTVVTETLSNDVHYKKELPFIFLNRFDSVRKTYPRPKRPTDGQRFLKILLDIQLKSGTFHLYEKTISHLLSRGFLATVRTRRKAKPAGSYC